MKKIINTDEEWRQLLTPEQFQVTRSNGTERPFCGTFHAHHEPGIHSCVCCKLPLFDSDAKFDSGTGWPSFFKPVASENIATRTDLGGGMRRTEILCARCDAHLGHVFEDGPPPTGLRYCLNSAALTFTPRSKLGHDADLHAGAPTPAATHGTLEGGSQLERGLFAAGCFWGVEAEFRAVKGVKQTRTGYSGGHTKNPTYEQVCTDNTGHAETVEVFFDPTVVTYEKLLRVFWEIHDPTTLNRQGPDVGSQYRSVIFYTTPEQKAAAEDSKARLRKAGIFKKPVVTEIVQASTFYPAEEYHQRYNEKHGNAACHLRRSLGDF